MEKPCERVTRHDPRSDKKDGDRADRAEKRERVVVNEPPKRSADAPPAHAALPYYAAPTASRRSLYAATSSGASGTGVAAYTYAAAPPPHYSQHHPHAHAHAHVHAHHHHHTAQAGYPVAVASAPPAAPAVHYTPHPQPVHHVVYAAPPPHVAHPAPTHHPAQVSHGAPVMPAPPPCDLYDMLGQHCAECARSMRHKLNKLAKWGVTQLTAQPHLSALQTVDLYYQHYKKERKRADSFLKRSSRNSDSDYFGHNTCASSSICDPVEDRLDRPDAPVPPGAYGSEAEDQDVLEEMAT